MGMFDYIKLEIKCPICEKKVSGFQSKDGTCLMNELEFWEVNNFYSSCSYCSSWIEFNIKQKLNKKLILKDYQIEFSKPKISFTGKSPGIRKTKQEGTKE